MIKLFLLLILLILLIIFTKKSLINIKKENYSNYSNIECPKLIKNLSNFCMWDKDIDSCKCVFQKAGDYFYNFPQCCNKKCNELNKEQCVSNKSNIYYYCKNNSGTDCNKYSGYIENDKISGNICGIEILTNNYKQPYMSYEECKKDLNICNQYKTKDKCINNNKCGWCSNNERKGLCIEGTSSGPIDLFKYNYCDPNNKNNNNSWSYGKEIKF